MSAPLARPGTTAPDGTTTAPSSPCPNCGTDACPVGVEGRWVEHVCAWCGLRWFTRPAVDGA